MSRKPLDVQALLASQQAQKSMENKAKFLSSSQRREQKAAVALAKRAHEVEQRVGIRGIGPSVDLNEPEDQKLSADARKRYLGTDERASRKKRINDPRKFNFDWNGTDDTSEESNPIYNDRHSAQFYGRGRIGGFESSDSSIAYTKAVHAVDPERAAALMDRERRIKQKVIPDDQHWRDKDLGSMRERDWRIFKEDFSIQIKGGSVPNPIRSWAEANFPKHIMDVIESVGYNEPTPIQRATIPIGMQSRDIIGIAETGSGKTASFVLPMLVYISSLPPLDEQNKNDGPYAIVLAPTRELAQQIEIETRKFASVMGMTVVSIVGGHAIEEQAFNLRNGAEILIATPGRLLDCLERHVLVLSQCTYVVMDEADRMVDLGFEEAVNQVLEALPVHNAKPDSDDAEVAEKMSALIGGRERFRQTVMFSATMPPVVEKLARKYLRRPATVIVGNAGQVVDTVEQRVEIVNGDDKKKRRMEAILASGEFDRPVIIFVNTKRNCDILSKHLGMIGWTSVTLHGGKTQDQREMALSKLRSGEADVLVATDLAGRGIDVPGVSLVLNFNMSKTIEDYVHRIGRTGRAGKKGVALTFIGEDEEALFYPLKVVLKDTPNIPGLIRNATKLSPESRQVTT